MARTPRPRTPDAYPYTPMDLARIERRAGANILGTPDQVKAGIEALAERFGSDEVIVLTICHDFAARVRSYELVAQAFGLA